MLGVHLIVSGLVQGVGFRYFVYQKATAYHLTGFVRNLYSGEVEIIAIGERGMLEMLIADIKIGSRSAIVRDMRVAWIDQPDSFAGFEIR